MFSLDDLLRAGVNLADHLVIANKESSNAAEEETLADCNTIVAVQTIFRWVVPVIYTGDTIVAVQPYSGGLYL